LGGVLTGLAFMAKRTACTDCLVLPCDMPLLLPVHLRHLAAHYRPGMPALVAAFGGRVHPLVGIYSCASIPVLRAACLDGRLRMMDVLKELGAATLEFPEEMAGDAFTNVNHREDLR
jgi:molybdenum cofactor guanylyltransferase